MIPGASLLAAFLKMFGAMLVGVKHRGLVSSCGLPLSPLKTNTSRRLRFSRTKIGEIFAPPQNFVVPPSEPEP